MLGIDFFSMSDIEDSHASQSIINLINYSVVSRSYAPTLASSQFLAAGRSRISSQCCQYVSYARVVLFGQAGELFLSATKDEDFVVQLSALDLFDCLCEWNDFVV
jgi:hypothetical protein